MVPRSSHVVFAFTAFLLVTGSDPRAEVVARTDRYGNYAGVEFVTSDMRGTPVVWGPSGRASQGYVLNPSGDQTGDMWPVVAESPFGARHPWVVWSQFNGQDYDLVWSRWNGLGWQPIQPISAEPTPGHDLDPNLTFDGSGRPQLTWSREENGVSEIQFSSWLKRRWTVPVVVSEPGVDSRYPVILDFGPGSVDIEYTTPDSVVVKRVLFSVPGTITDDINPLRQQRAVVIPIFKGPVTARWEDR